MRAEDLAALQAAGLYNPTAPNAAQRLALIEWLAEQGASVEQMIDAAVTRATGTAASERTLTSVAGDLLLRGTGPRLTIGEVAARAKMPVERLERIRLAIGLPPARPAERLFSESDAAAYAMFDQGAKVFGEAATLEFMRVIGTSLARIAEAAVSLFLVNIEGPIVDKGADELALAKANVQVIRTFDIIPPAISLLLRAHLETAIRRMRNARQARSVDLVSMAVGFVDLVGFTALSRKLSARELAELVAHFEGVAHDIVTARDGRLVKLIGDEVMFVAVDVAAACDAALTLVERVVGENPGVTPRGGLAAGPLLMRGGDYYGPIVNLASRIAELAVPKEVLVTEELVARAGADRFRFEPAGKRLLKGFDEPVALFTAARR